MYEAIKQHYGSIWSHPALIQERSQDLAGTGNVLNATLHRQAEEAIESKMRAMFMLDGTNKDLTLESMPSPQELMYCRTK